MPNADDTKPIDLDAIEALLLKSERATAFAVAILGPGSNEPADSLMAAVRALLAEVRRVTTERDEVFGESLVACAILGADPTAPGYDYLETLRAVVKERKDAVDAFHRCRVERDAANTERDEVRALQAEQQRAFVEGLRVANKAARTEGARVMHAAVKRALIVDDTEDSNDWLDAAYRALRLDPAAVAAEPES